MNIFRHKYRMIKEKLKAFGEQAKHLKSKARYTAAFWRERLNSLDDKHTWEYIITEYLAYWCTDEECEFIDSVFFNACSAVKAGNRFYISESLYFYKREHILTDIIGLALQAGLTTVEPIQNQETAATADNRLCDIFDDVWIAIDNLITEVTKRKYDNNRDAVKAMLYIETNKLPWRELPREYGDWNSVYKRYKRWRKMGLWDRLLEIIENYK